jgi:O-antigen ligase
MKAYTLSSRGLPTRPERAPYSPKHFSSIAFAVLVTGFLLSFFSVTESPQMFLGDVCLAAVGVPALLLIRLSKQVWRVVSIGCLYLLYASIIAYFYHESEAWSIINYLGLNALWLIGTVAFYVLVRHEGLLVAWLLLALAIAFGLQALYFGSPLRDGKGGYDGGGAAALIYALLGLGALLQNLPVRQKVIGLSLLVAYLAVSGAATVIALEGRDRGGAIGIIMLAGLALVLARGSVRLRRWLSARPLQVAVVGVASAFVLVIGQYELAQSGVLPRDVSEKIIDQWNHRNGYLVAARPDSVSAFLVALDRPFLGYGTSSRDPEALKRYAEVVAYESIGELERYFDRSDGYVPLHSTMGGAWARVGLPGLLVWVGVAVLLWRGSVVSLANGGPLAMLTCGGSMIVLYGIFFEPTADRYLFPLALACALHAWSHRPARIPVIAGRAGSVDHLGASRDPRTRRPPIDRDRAALWADRPT